MRKAQMQETPPIYPCSDIAPKNADPEAAILARVYALILKWSREADSLSNQGVDEHTAQSGTDSDEQQDGEVESSTLTTE
jgi:hypothetical protein